MEMSKLLRGNSTMKSLIKTGYLRSISVGMVSVIGWIILLTVGALRCTVATAQSATNIPSTLFGMTLANDANWPTVPVGALGKLNGVRWPDMEPQKGVFNWTKLDAGLSIAKSHGIDVFFSNGRVPQWAAADQNTCFVDTSGNHLCTSMVANIQDWDDFITALAIRYKGTGLIYELWNEPNNPHNFTGTVTDMVTLTTHAYNIIRSTDPQALILAPSPSPGGTSWMDQYFAAGGPIGIDIIGIHDYWPAPEGVISESNKMLAVMAKYGLSSKPLWDTEGSWGQNILTSDQQVGYVARSYLLHQSQAV